MFPLGSRPVPGREPRAKRILLLDRLISVRAVLRSFSILLIFLSTAASSDVPEPVSNRPAKQPFTIDDYFKIKRVTELALSSDGEMIAYAVEWQSLEENKTLRRIYVSATAPGAEAELIKEIQDARSLAWIPGRHELAFLSGRGGVTQVFAYDLASQAIRQRTDSKAPVVKFRLAPDGQSLAYVAQEASDGAPSLYEQFQTGDTGILIDPDVISVYDFVNPDWPKFFLRPQRNLWVEIEKNLPIQTVIPGNVSEFYWSSDATKLSVTYVADDIPVGLGSDRQTSLGIYDIEKRNFRILAPAEPAAANQVDKSYSGGEWGPDGNGIFLRRTVGTSSRVNRSYPKWTLVDLSSIDTLDEAEQTWREIEIYGLDPEPAFIPVDKTTIYTNRMIEGARSLYRITSSGGFERADILKDMRGSVSLVRFSVDFEKAAFVNESLTQPQEIYFWLEGQSARQLTRLNEVLAKRILPTAKEVTWKSKDDTTVHGWLLEPVQAESSRKLRPLITYVHGGPSLAMSNEFASNFLNWPYPFEVYALNGIAVFIPNYRGTKTYGRRFTDALSIDGESVDDIVSGIEYLIKNGVAHPDRLGISGHSHGAWLGPLVMARAKIFRVGSFAEGMSNTIVNYNLMSGMLNRLTHDVVNGGSLYSNPIRYLELSPELHFGGLKTAVLFEAGTRASAINMLGYPKAARNAGMPAEFFVYPKIGHTVTAPRLQKESAERNLDWLRFWLKCEGDPARAVRFRRWQKMQAQQERRSQITDDYAGKCFTEEVSARE